jgi:3-oxoadipate enol-lactonase
VNFPVLAATAPAGPAGAPLVLLGPSLGTSTLLWDAAAALLQSTFRTVSWDLPGHGRSPATTRPLTVAELAQGVAAILDELGEARALVVGVSLGGAVGLTFARDHPQRCAALAVVCSGAVIGTEGWRDRAAAVRSQGTASLVVPSAQRWFAPDSTSNSPGITGRLLHALRDADDESYALCCEALAGYDVRPDLGRMTVPVLALWGEYDEVTPEASADEIAQGIMRGGGSARVAKVANASHLAPAEQPVAVAELLTAFFEENR